MITKLIADLKGCGGSSRQAIPKYIIADFQVSHNAKVFNMHLKQALNHCLANGIVINPKGTGVTGSFKLARRVMAVKPKAVKPATPTLRKPQSRKQPNLLQLKGYQDYGW